jgi:hypothetical protein
MKINQDAQKNGIISTSFHAQVSATNRLLR